MASVAQAGSPRPLDSRTSVPAHAADSRFDFLDGLRGIAALTIAIHHFTALSGRREIFASAHIAVDFFFCLSGFVIALAYHDRLRDGMSLVAYAKKRLARLYPMFLVGMALGLVAMQLLRVNGLTDYTWTDIASGALLNLFYLPYLNGDYMRVFEARIVGAIFPLNTPAWSLFFGLGANLLFALSLRGSRAMPILILALSAVGMSMATYAYGEAPGWGTANYLGGIPRVLFAFFAGVVLYQAYRRAPWRGVAGPVFVALLVLGIVVVPRFPGHAMYWLGGALLAAPAIVAMACAVEMRKGSPGQRLCAYAGKLSYPLFCLHYPLLMVLSIAPGRTVPFPLLLLAFIVVSLGFAHFAAVNVEPPMRAWLERRLGVS
jgi:peptidoglycan/LPS O-acetylase OafA/YrhL